MRSRADLIAGVAALALCGCALGPNRQVMDPAAAARVHSVLVVGPPNQERFSSAISDSALFAPAGGAPAALAVLQLGILLAQVADAQHKTALLTAALAPEQVRLQEQLGVLLRDGLAEQGYEARVVVLPVLGQSEATPPWMRGQAFDQALPELRRQTPADAALLFMLDAQVRPDSATQGICPALNVKARVVDLGSGTTLYEDSFEYGPESAASAAPRRFACDARYRFADFEALLADPARLHTGWQAGVRIIADEILSDILRRPPE